MLAGEKRARRDETFFVVVIHWYLGAWLNEERKNTLCRQTYFLAMNTIWWQEKRGSGQVHFSFTLRSVAFITFE